MYTDVATAQRYTLVVGAGINANRGVPGWTALVRRAWQEVFGEEGNYRRDCAKRLAEARAAVRKHCGWPDADVQRLDIPIHPFEPQFALELIDLEIRGNPSAGERVRRLVAENMPHIQVAKHTSLLPVLLARCLYEHVRRDGQPDTLSELARFVRCSKRLVRVISLNVDNLLELEVECVERRKKDGRYLEVISRQRHRPGYGIPTYHLHGFLPLNLLKDLPDWLKPKEGGASTRRYKTGQVLEHMIEPVPEGLVFTDAQYWQSVATPLSFANFVFANALHDSSCIFVGLSMTDLNIIRWLGMYTTEFRREYERELTEKGLTDYGTPNPYVRHCWIRADSSDPTGLVTRFLATRGVYTHQLRHWEAAEVREVLDELQQYDHTGKP